MSNTPQQPNILFVQVDQWRGDCLSIGGHPVVHTPYLDQLAMDGVRFTRAYSATPVCIPARAALMTGLKQGTHGRVGYKDGVPWDYPVTLGGEFTRHGYRPHAVGKFHAYPQDHKLGFESVELHDGYLHFGRREDGGDGATHDAYLKWLREETGRPDADYFEHGINCNSVVARPWPFEEYLHPTNWCINRAVQFLRNHDRERPFFLYVSLHRPHPPYDPPGWAMDQYLHADMPEPPVGDWVDYFEKFDRTPRPDAIRARYRPDILQRARAGYYGHMTHIDHQINRLVESLGDLKLGHNTWVCFTSDHGEMMGDHHFFRKGMAYEGSAHVPFLLAGPGLTRHNVTSDAVVEQRDIMPTLLDCAGLPIPSSVEGRSVLPVAQGEKTKVRDYLHGELTIFGQSMQWITDGKEKYIWMSLDGAEQYFDLVKDPRECRDLARHPSDAERARMDHWRQCLIQELEGREEGFVQKGDLIIGCPVTCVLKNAPGTRDTTT